MPKGLLETEIESGPKGALMSAFRVSKRGIAIRLENTVHSGDPDIVYTWNRKTSWWEVKLADPDFSSNGLQELTMLRLSTWGFYAAYIIFEQEPRNVYIVQPNCIADWRTRRELVIGGWDFRGVVDYIQGIHKP